MAKTGRRLDQKVGVDPRHACPHSLSRFLVFPSFDGSVARPRTYLSCLEAGTRESRQAGIHQRGAPCLTVAFLATNLLSLLNFSNPAQTRVHLNDSNFNVLCHTRGIHSMRPCATVAGPARNLSPDNSSPFRPTQGDGKATNSSAAIGEQLNGAGTPPLDLHSRQGQFQRPSPPGLQVRAPQMHPPDRPP